MGYSVLTENPLLLENNMICSTSSPFPSGTVLTHIPTSQFLHIQRLWHKYAGEGDKEITPPLNYLESFCLHAGWKNSCGFLC